MSVKLNAGNTNGIPGKDYDYVGVGIAKSTEQISQLINLLKNMYDD